MQKMYYLRGHPTLEATIKNVDYGNKRELFLHIYIFFTTFAIVYQLSTHHTLKKDDTEIAK